MLRRSLGLKAVLGFFCVAMLSAVVFADTIRLKDGSLIKGTIVGFTGGRFDVVIGEGARRREFSIAAEDVASIEFEPRNDANSRSASLSRPAQNSPIVPVSSRTQPPKVVVRDTTNAGTGKTVQNPPTQQRSTSSAQNPPVLQRSTSVQNPPNQQKTASVPVQTAPVTKSSTDVPTLSNPPVNTPADSSTTGAAKPISLTLKVLADNTANGWTNSGFVVKRGQRIRVTGSGTVSLGKGQTSTPSGLPDLDDDQKLLKAVPTGALIAVIGDDNNDFIYIGESREFTAGRDGALYLGVNEGNLNDNKGAYDVKVEIIPDK